MHLRDLRGPRLVWVFVFRDPVVIVMRQAREDSSFVDCFEHVAKDCAELNRFALDVTEPKALASYEKTLVLPEQARLRLGHWLDGERFLKKE